MNYGNNVWITTAFGSLIALGSASYLLGTETNDVFVAATIFGLVQGFVALCIAVTKRVHIFKNASWFDVFLALVTATFCKNLLTLKKVLKNTKRNFLLKTFLHVFLQNHG